MCRRDEAQRPLVQQQRDQSEHDLQGLEAEQTQQQTRSQPGNPLPGILLMPLALCHLRVHNIKCMLHCLQMLFEGTRLSHKSTPRSNPPRAGTGKHGLSVHDSADRRKRQVIDATQANGEVASQAQHAAASTQPQVAAALENQTGAPNAAASEDTQSNRPADGSAPADDVQQADAEGSQTELICKLAANLQMALKALSLLKGVDFTVFEHLQPADLGDLDLHTLCQTPGSTPEP